MSIKKSTHKSYVSNSIVRTIGSSPSQYFFSSSSSVNLKNISVFNINNKILLKNKIDELKYSSNVKDLTGLRSISSGKISYIYLGKTALPDKEFLDTANKEYVSSNTNYSINYDYFFPSESKNCIKYFLFANIIPKRKDVGIVKSISNNDLEVPYSKKIPPPFFYFEKNRQTTFIHQDNLNSGKIYISGFELIFENSDLSFTGVPVIHNKIIDVDSWYNANFKNKMISENIGIGYLNDYDEEGNPVYSLGERYKWSFGSIYFTLNIASKIGKNIVDPSYKCCSSQNSFSIGGDLFENNRFPEKILSGVEIKYIPSNTEEIKLKAWMFIVNNVLGEKDEYNFNNKINWDFNIIPKGSKKYEVHIPQQLTLPVSAHPITGDLFWINTNVITSGEVPITGTAYFHHSVDSTCQIQDESISVNPYNPSSNENFYNFYNYSDNKFIRDIGIYYSTIPKWEKQIYGKGIYEHYIRNIDPTHCTSLSIAPISQNIVINDEGCFSCYYRKYVYCNTLKIKNIYFIGKYKCHFVNWEDRDFCDQNNAEEWKNSDYDYNDHSSMIIGPLKVEQEKIDQNNILYHIYADKDSLFVLYTAKGISYDCHELLVYKNTINGSNISLTSFPVSSFPAFPYNPPSLCKTDSVTYSSVNPRTIFVKKGEKIRLFLKNLSNVHCYFGTSISSYNDELHTVSKRPAAKVEKIPPPGFYSGGSEICQPITYQVVSSNISSLSSFLFTENVREFVENNLKAKIKLNGKFLGDATELVIDFPDHLYNPNGDKNFYLLFLEQEQDEKGNWILTYDVYQKANNQFSNGLRISSVYYIKNKDNINHHIVFDEQEEYDSIAGYKISLNINDFDLSCFQIQGLTNDNIDLFVRNSYGLGIKSRNANDNEHIVNLSSTFYFDLLSVENITSTNDIKVVYGYKDPFNEPFTDAKYDGLLEIYLKKCVPNSNENYMYLGELKIIVENTCEGIEFTPPEPEVIEFPDIPPPPPPSPPSPPPPAPPPKVCYKIIEFKYQRGEALCNHIPKLYYVANNLSIKSVALSSSSPQQTLSQTITDSICHEELWYKIGGWSEHSYLSCCHYKPLLYQMIYHDTENKIIRFASEDQCDVDYNDGYVEIKYTTCQDCQEGTFNIQVESPPEMCYRIIKFEYKRGEAWCKHQPKLYYYALDNNNNIIVKSEEIISAEGPGNEGQTITKNITDSICYTDIHSLYKLSGFSNTPWLSCCHNKNLIYKFVIHDVINNKIVWEIEDQCDTDDNDATVTIYYEQCASVKKCSNVTLPQITFSTPPNVCFSLKKITYQKGEAVCAHYPKILYKNNQGNISEVVLTVSGSNIVQEATFSINCGGCCFNVNGNEFLNIINLIKLLDSPTNSASSISFGDCFTLTSNNSTPLQCCNTLLKYYCKKIIYNGPSILFVFAVEDGCDLDFNDAQVTVQIDVCVV